MEEVAAVLLALGLTWMGEQSENPIFRMASALVFLYIAFAVGEPFILVALVAIAIIQVVRTFWGRG